MHHSKSPDIFSDPALARSASIAQIAHALGPLSTYIYRTGSPCSRAAVAKLPGPWSSQSQRLRDAWRADPIGLDAIRQRAWTQAQSRAMAYVRGVDPPCEVQRSGLLGHPELHGELFLALLFQAALPRSLRSPLPARAHDRYYRELPQMPADLDTAAAIVLSEAELPEHLLTAAQERIERAMGQPQPPVWEHTTEWFGPYCPAVLGRALRAGAKLGLSAHPACIQALSGAPSWTRGVHYPDPVVATSLVATGLRAQGQPSQRLESLLGSAPCESWSALALAAAALTLAGRPDQSAPGLPRRRERLLVGLLKRQRWDGGWSGGPWFLVPYPQERMGPYCSDAATSAMALRALGVLRVSPLEDLREAAPPQRARPPGQGSPG